MVHDDGGHLVALVELLDRLRSCFIIVLNHERPVACISDILDRIGHGVLASAAIVGHHSLEEVIVAELGDQITALLHHEVDDARLELRLVSVDLSLTWLVDLRGLVSRGQRDELLDASVLNAINIEDESAQLLEGLSWVQHNVLIAHDMAWNLGFEPEVVEVTPDADFLLDELDPWRWELVEV